MSSDADSHGSVMERLVAYKGESMAEIKKHDPVNHPRHYTTGNIEVIDFLEDQKLNLHLGTAVKYICRAKHKNGIEDLKKAQWYLNRAIEKGLL
jgi:hypothetical protein